MVAHSGRAPAGSMLPAVTFSKRDYARRRKPHTLYTCARYTKDEDRRTPTSNALVGVRNQPAYRRLCRGGRIGLIRGRNLLFWLRHFLMTFYSLDDDAVLWKATLAEHR